MNGITPIRSFYTPSGRIIVSKTHDGHFIESTEMRDVTVDGKDHSEVREALDPLVVWRHLAPVDEKWLLTVSTQVGCPYKCKFCDVAKLGFQRSLSVEEMLEQVELLVRSTPEIKASGTRKAKIGFARMGEPMCNLENVLKAIDCLKGGRGLGKIDWLPCFNSIVPNVVQHGGERIHGLDALGLVIDAKENEKWNGRMHVQISCNSTDEAKRRELFGGAGVVPINMIIESIAERRITNRTITLNFIAMRGVEVSVDKLLKFGLSPEKFAVKLIPLNKTNNAAEHGLESEFNYKNIERMHELGEEFRVAGIPVVTDVVARCEEASLCCGMLVREYW